MPKVATQLAVAKFITHKEKHSIYTPLKVLENETIRNAYIYL